MDWYFEGLLDQALEQAMEGVKRCGLQHEPRHGECNHGGQHGDTQRCDPVTFCAWRWIAQKTVYARLKILAVGEKRGRK